MSVRVLWYPVELTAPNVLPGNPFVLRNWDRMSMLDQTELGTDQQFVEYYFGPRPEFPPGEPCGSADQWANGLLYSTWIGGGYACTCPVFTVPSYVSSVACDDDSLAVSPHVGDVIVDLNVAHSNSWIADQTFLALVDINVSALPNFVGFQFFGQVGGVPQLIVSLVSNGEIRFAGEVNVLSKRVVLDAALRVQRDHLGVGIDIADDQLGTPTKPFLRCLKGGPTVQFAVHKDGQIWTNQAVALTDSGSPVLRMPIYDGSGTLLGYIPIYDTNP